MPGFLREHSWSIAFSVLLHGLLAAALVFAALISLNRSTPTKVPLPIDAVVIDSQVLHAAQRELADRAEKEAARARAVEEQQRAAKEAEATAAADAEKAAAEAAREADAQKAELAQAKRADDAKRAEDAKRADETKRAEDAKRVEQAKRAEEAKRAELAKQAEDAKRAADAKAKAEREAELRRQLAEEEHVSAVEASPARAQYIARLASRIQNAWIKPPSARAGLDCIVNITQLPGGTVANAVVSQCNGDAAARQSIENAVYRASPLPPPPDPALFERNLVIHFHPQD
ncbi:MAG TPA: cell envelope integrity protein TolA [Steroidobacteraceae bacterium]|nr:cell envelope integrity protein TolA [Steroidobacteraceae bacterium]